MSAENTIEDERITGAARQFLRELRAIGGDPATFEGILDALCLALDERVICERDALDACAVVHVLSLAQHVRRERLDLGEGVVDGPLHPEAARWPRVLHEVRINDGTRIEEMNAWLDRVIERPAPSNVVRLADRRKAR